MKSILLLIGLSVAGLSMVGCAHDRHHSSRDDYGDTRIGQGAPGYDGDYYRYGRRHDYDARPAGGRMDPYRDRDWDRDRDYHDRYHDYDRDGYYRR